MTPAQIVADCFASRGLHPSLAFRAHGRGSGQRAVCLARGAAAMILRERGYSYPEIARLMERNSHSTIHNAHGRYVEELFRDDRTNERRTRYDRTNEQGL